MKKDILLLKLGFALNVAVLAGYIGYNEWQKYLAGGSQEMELVCQILGVDSDTNLVAVKCLKR